MKEYGKVIENALISDYTTYKLSGKINKVVYPDSLDKLKDLIRYLKDNKIKYMIVGNGSNLVFLGDYDGVIIKLDKFNGLNIDKNIVKVGAGYSLIKLSMTTAREGLSGLEFASGIPGTIGGAIYMNAGAYNASISDVVDSVTVLDDNLDIRKLSFEELLFGYRNSVLREKDYICLEATLKLRKGKEEEILELIKNRKHRRLKSQPLEYPSAGSVFRNPEGDYAGRLIEEVGLKGMNINGAEVSNKHANFIINKGGASGEDIQKLIILVKKTVKERYGIELREEQEFVE